MATYYVATSGDDGNAGTLAEPWLTWHYAFNQLSAGDTLNIRAGTYTDMFGLYSGAYYGVRANSAIYGTSGSHITIQKYASDVGEAILDCSSLISDTEPHRGIAFDGCEYIDVIGLTVINLPENTNEVNYNYADGFAVYDCNHMTFTRCVAHDIEGSGFALGGSNDEIYYTNCDAYQCADHSDDGGYANGFSCNIDVGNHIYYDGCRAWLCSDDGWDSYGGAGFIYMNACWAFENGAWDGEYGNGAGFKTGANTRETDENGTQRKLTNCLSFSNTGYGYDESQDNTDGYAMQHEIYNCVSYDNLTGFNFGYGAGWGGSTATDYIKNCISYGDGDIDNGWGSNTVTYNSWNNPPNISLDSGDFAGLTSSQAKGARQANGDLPVIDFLHLATGSDAENVGTDVSLTYDGDGELWDDPPSIGAFEYQAPITSPPITSPPITSPPITSPPITSPPITSPPVSPPYEPPPTPYDPEGSTGTVNISSKKCFISRCIEGIYLRWWFNGWHYFNFTNGYEIEMNTESKDVQVTNFFSVISKVERNTRITTEYGYKVTLHGIRPGDIEAFTGMLLAEKVEQYESSVWRQVYITRGTHLIKFEGTNAYVLDFEITRNELPDSPAVFQKSLRLYLGDTLCDMDDDEIVPINKQVNDIAELQDRNSDYTAEFKIRKTRAMRTLFELSGDVGSDTTFPYERQTCRLIQDNIEIITNGIMILNKVDDEYYYVNISSGNINFFNLIAKLKITDLTLASMEHEWDETFIVASHTVVSPMPDVVYPLCEPSDDGGMCPLTDDGDRVELWGEWLRAFCKVKTIWEEIFSNAGFTVTGGEVISSDIFDRLYMPISSLKITNTEKYMYSVWWSGSRSVVVNEILAFPGAILINGDASFQGGYYICPFTATYTIRVMVLVGSTPVAPTLTLWKWFATNLGEIPMVNAGLALWEYQIEQTATVGDILFIVTGNYFYSYYSVEIIKIDNPSVGFGSTVDCRNLLPAMTQTDFIKLICNVFALVPEVNARDHTVRFWNYQELYDNIPYARDWSKYLSERDDEVEFKFGDYAQENILKYNDSDDVQPSKGKGIMPIDDETLPEEKDLVELSVSTADEVRILLNVFPVDVARIAFNKYDAQDSVYKPNDSIDPRIVYVDRVPSVASPAYEKTLGITYTDPIFGETTIDITSPLKASTLTLSFSNLIIYYANISRMLTRTKLRRAKFNLPVYEVAGLRHNIPIYLSQYKAYFYVNKISNYVAGRLCTIDLIRL